jgi:hypothetical protein
VRTPGPNGCSVFTARTPGVPQVCDAVAVLVSPSAKSLVIPTVSLPVQSAAQGEHPRSGSCNTSDRRLPVSESRVPRASCGGAGGRVVVFGTLFWTRCCRTELRFYFDAAVSGAMFRPCDDAARAQAHRHEPGRPLQLSPAPRPHPRSPATMAGDRSRSSPWRSFKARIETAGR